MVHGNLTLRASGTDPTPITSSLTKGRMAQALRKGLVLSFELSILVLLLFLRFVEFALAPTRCVSVIDQPANSPKSQCSKNPRPQARGEVCRSLTEDDELNGPQRPHLNTPVSRTPLMRSLPSILPETSTTQHKEPSPSREPVKGRIFPRVDSVDELDICRITDDGPSLPVTHSKRPVLYRLPNMPDGTNSPTSTTIPARPVNLGQMVHKRHQTMLHYDGEANLRESPPMRQEGNASNAFSTISISRTAIELQPNIVEPSLLQDPLSPSRPAAHIELPHRRVSENLTHDTQHVLRSVEGGSPKLTDSLSYLRTLSKAKKATAGSASAISKRYQSHSNVPNTTL